MHRGFQLSLLETGQGKGHLFGKGVLNKHLEQHRTTPIPNELEIAATLREWLASLDATTATESSLESKFISRVMCYALGYEAYPAPADKIATLYPKPSSRITGIKRQPDAVLGEFQESEAKFIASLELKSPGTDLDLPQASYNYETPVEQSFYYGKNILGMRWVLVSDMERLRLYSVESEDEYEEVLFADCIDDHGDSTAELRRLIFLFHYDHLIRDGSDSQVSLLYGKSADRQIEIRDSFYEIYYQIRSDLFEAIKAAAKSLTPAPDRQELLEATQRLLDRQLFIYYCEDHPQQLIKKGMVEDVISKASGLPGPMSGRIYEYIKLLFREIDVGSPASSGVKVAAYNGELFKRHRVIDYIDLPDSLNNRFYSAAEQGGDRVVKGVWGLHRYDFWSELNEYLLGHIFEESLSDLRDLGTTAQSALAEKLRERKSGGIFFTSSILADFLCSHAIRVTLDEMAPLRGDADDGLEAALQKRVSMLTNLRAVDFACGSGAFLASLYREMLQEFYRVHSSIASLKARNAPHEVDLLSSANIVEEARTIPRCLFGVDRLPQAAEIAKLAIWLRSARKDEKVLDLSRNIVSADSLALPDLFDRLGAASGTFDLVVGNPPWGGDIDPDVYNNALKYFEIDENDSEWDSWELFVMLGLRALREGGRLALVLPDSFLYPQKARIRKFICQHATIEKVHNLGPDWFGPNVRMGTVVIQVKRGPVNAAQRIRCMVLAGDLRTRAIRGQLPLTQIESQRSRFIPCQRVLDSETAELEVFRSEDDDRIIQQMMSRSIALQDMCERARGEEINKAGLVWVCPSCLCPTTPGEKKKGGGYKDKPCEKCGHILTISSVRVEELVSVAALTDEIVSFIDGDDINRRYVQVTPGKRMRLGLSGWAYKDSALYRSPKVLVRQAGVGICATLDETNSRCPQSVYIYRLRDDFVKKGYAHEYLLAAILSRTMAYLVFKRFSEVDPAKAHAKVTHERLASLPIPAVDFQRASERRAHDIIVANVRSLLTGEAKLGGEEDREIEYRLRRLWGLSASDGAYVNGEFFDLPDGQAIRDLFPDGRPKPVRREMHPET
ncbi:MAG TPA: N-6 DNA methylase [Pirellulales bacterium]|nr:N-6 DNA methylase [Pirellulales bacterium]